MGKKAQKSYRYDSIFHLVTDRKLLMINGALLTYLFWKW